MPTDKNFLGGIDVNAAGAFTSGRFLTDARLHGAFLNPNLNFDKTKSFVDQLVPVQPQEVSRVVSQDPAPGTTVPRGTKVNLVLVAAGVITFDLFQQTHSALRTRPVTDITGGILEDTEIRELLLRYDSPDEVPAAEKAKLIAAFKTKAGVEVNEASPDTSFAAAFNAIRGAMAFR